MAKFRVEVYFSDGELDEEFNVETAERPKKLGRSAKAIACEEAAKRPHHGNVAVWPLESSGPGYVFRRDEVPV